MLAFIDLYLLTFDWLISHSVADTYPSDEYDRTNDDYNPVAATIEVRVAVLTFFSLL